MRKTPSNSRKGQSWPPWPWAALVEALGQYPSRPQAWHGAWQTAQSPRLFCRSRQGNWEPFMVKLCTGGASTATRTGTCRSVSASSCNATRRRATKSGPVDGPTVQTASSRARGRAGRSR